MSASEDEEQLRGQVERSVAGMPGPDPARMARIRQGLRTERRKKWPGLWLAFALAFGLGTAATAAWFVQEGASRVNAEDVNSSGDDTATAERQRKADDSSDRSDDEQQGTVPSQPSDADGETTIYRE